MRSNQTINVQFRNYVNNPKNNKNNDGEAE